MAYDEMTAKAVRDAARLEAALRDLVDALREYGTFPPNIIPALKAAGRALAARGVLGTPAQLCQECGGLGHFPFGRGNSAGNCADCNGTGRVPAGVLGTHNEQGEDRG